MSGVCVLCVVWLSDTHPVREFQERDKEVKANRLSSSEIQRLQEEAARKWAEERKDREEKTKRKSEESRMKYMEEVCSITS